MHPFAHLCTRAVRWLTSPATHYSDQPIALSELVRFGITRCETVGVPSSARGRHDLVSISGAQSLRHQTTLGCDSLYSSTRYGCAETVPPRPNYVTQATCSHHSGRRNAPRSALTVVALIRLRTTGWCGRKRPVSLSTQNIASTVNWCALQRTITILVSRLAASSTARRRLAAHVVQGVHRVESTARSSSYSVRAPLFSIRVKARLPCGSIGFASCAPGAWS